MNEANPRQSQEPVLGSRISADLRVARRTRRANNGRTYHA